MPTHNIGGERRARAVLDYDLPRASDLEFAEKTGRCRPDHRLQSFEASRSGGVAGIGGDRRRRRSVHLDLLLNERAPAQGVENGEYPDYVADHLSTSKTGDGRLDDQRIC